MTISKNIILKRQKDLLSVTKRFKTRDYLLAFFLLQIGWFSILLDIYKLELVLVFVVFIIAYQKVKNRIINDKIVLIFIIYTIIAFLQGILWGFSIVTLITSFSFAFFLPYCLFRIYKSDLLFILEKVIRVLTYIALTIWLLHQFVPGARGLIVNLIIMVNKYNTMDIYRNMIFYTYWPNVGQAFNLSRNAGFCNEPAAFSVIIILAIIINYVRNIQLLDRRNIVYYAALISTFSTTGYLAFISLGLLLIKQKKFKIVGVLLFPVIIYSASYAYKNLEFMKPKIEMQFQDQIRKKLDHRTSGRIYGARKSIVVLLKYPVFGRGLFAITKPGVDDPEFADYGWLSYISRFGVIFGALFMFYFLKGIYRFIKTGGYGLYEFGVCTLSIMILLSSQTLISESYFTIFFFIGFFNNRKVIRQNVATNSNKLSTYNQV